MRSAARKPVLVLVAVCTVAASCRSSTTVSPGPALTTTAPAAPARPCGHGHAAGQSSDTFLFEGQSRTYQLYVPRGYDGTHHVPVVFNFHGFGSNAAQQMVYGDFKPQADRDGFLIVAPDGQGVARHFNLTGEPGLQDDVVMVGALLDRIEATFCVDDHRVYSTGMSDGGAMTSVLACRLPDRFAAFGAVAVVIYVPGCGGKHSIALTAFSGTADPIVPFNGGKVDCCGGTTIGAAPDAMAGWAQHDGCSANFREDRLGTEVRRRSWTGCRGSGAVVFYIIDGGGHTWPGSVPFVALGLTTQQIKASDTIWEFLKTHPLSA